MNPFREYIETLNLDWTIADPEQTADRLELAAKNKATIRFLLVVGMVVALYVVLK